MNEPDVLRFHMGDDRIVLSLSISPRVRDSLTWDQVTAIADGFASVFRAAKCVAASRADDHSWVLDGSHI